MKFINKTPNKSKTSVFDEEFAEELTEDTTRYGEFIPTYFHWTTFKQQQERAKTLSKIGKTKNSHLSDNLE